MTLVKSSEIFKPLSFVTSLQCRGPVSHVAHVGLLVANISAILKEVLEVVARKQSKPQQSKPLQRKPQQCKPQISTEDQRKRKFRSTLEEENLRLSDGKDAANSLVTGGKNINSRYGRNDGNFDTESRENSLIRKSQQNANSSANVRRIEGRGPKTNNRRLIKSSQGAMRGLRNNIADVCGVGDTGGTCCGRGVGGDGVVFDGDSSSSSREVSQAIKQVATPPATSSTSLGTTPITKNTIDSSSSTTNTISSSSYKQLSDIVEAVLCRYSPQDLAMIPSLLLRCNDLRSTAELVIRACLLHRTQLYATLLHAVTGSRILPSKNRLANPLQPVLISLTRRNSIA